MARVVDTKHYVQLSE